MKVFEFAPPFNVIPYCYGFDFAARRRRRRRLKPRKQCKQRKPDLSIAGIVGRNVQAGGLHSHQRPEPGFAATGGRGWLCRPYTHTSPDPSWSVLHASVIDDCLRVVSYSYSGYCEHSHVTPETMTRDWWACVRRPSQNDEYTIWHMTSYSRVWSWLLFCKNKKSMGVECTCI